MRKFCVIEQTGVVHSTTIEWKSLCNRGVFIIFFCSFNRTRKRIVHEAWYAPSWCCGLLNFTVHIMPYILLFKLRRFQIVVALIIVTDIAHEVIFQTKLKKIYIMITQTVRCNCANFTFYYVHAITGKQCLHYNYKILHYFYLFDIVFFRYMKVTIYLLLYSNWAYT